MAVYVADPQFYVGLGFSNEGYNTKGAYEKFIDEWDSVAYEVRKTFRMLLKNNPNILPLLWLKPEHYLYVSDHGRVMIDNRKIFSSKLLGASFRGYAEGQFHRMTHPATGLGYMGAKRKKLVEKFGYDCKNASHLIRLLRMSIEMLGSEELHVHREADAKYLIDIKRGKYSLDAVMHESETLFSNLDYALEHTRLPDKPDIEKAERLLEYIVRDFI